MAYTDEFRELIADTRDVVEKLLNGSQPDSWPSLRAGYGELRRALTLDAYERNQEQLKQQREEQTAELEAWRERARERDQAWAETSTDRRETLLLQALGDDRLTIGQLTARLNAELDNLNSPAELYQSNVRSLVMRMFRAGQLDRAEESFKNKPRFRYFRKAGLDGPIADLEQAYHSDDEAVA